MVLAGAVAVRTGWARMRRRMGRPRWWGYGILLTGTGALAFMICGAVRCGAVRCPAASASPLRPRRPPAQDGLRRIFDPSHTSGSYLRSTALSFKGISALSVILMPSGQTSVQHLVMLQ